MTTSVEHASLRALLVRLASERVIRLTPRVALHAETLLSARGHEEPRALAAAIASLCTHSPERWRAVYRRCLEAFDTGGPSNDDEAGRAGPVDDVRPAPSAAPTRPRRSLRWLLAGIFVVALALAAVAVIVARGRGAADEPPQPTADPALEPRWLPRPLPAAIAGLLASCGLLLVGAHWLLSPARQRLRLREARAQIRGESRGSEVIYQVPRYEPFPAEVMDFAASMLGRSHGREAGYEIDIDATLDATCRAAGRLTPVMQSGATRRDLVVLVQEGTRSAHPLLGPVEALLERWRRAGLYFTRYDFQSQIESLRTHPQRSPVGLDALSWRSDTCSLLVIGYSTELVDKRGASTWLMQLRHWPVRALLDLDPRSDDELTGPDTRDALASRAAIKRADLRCFPFTAEGLERLARYIGSAGRIQINPDGPGLRPLPEIRDALAKWASCLACVPDPSWEQLEDFRRCFNTRFFGGLLDDPRYVWRLLDWLRREKGVPQPIGPDGRTVEIADEICTDLLAEFRRTDDRGGKELERSAHARLLEHLAAARPTTAYDSGRRALKQLEHKALLADGDEQSTGRELAAFVGTAFELDVLRLARLTDLRFMQAGRTPPPWVRDVLQAARDERISTRELLAPYTFRGTCAPPLALLAGAGTWLAWFGHSAGHSLGALWIAVGAALSASSLGALAAARHCVRAATDEERDRLLEGPVGERSAATSQIASAAEWSPAETTEPETLTPRERYALACLRPRPPLSALGDLEDSPTGEAYGVVYVALADVAPMVFLGLSGGTFTMGSRDDDRQAQRRERPRSRRYVSAFAIAATPVTQAQYQAVMSDNPSRLQGAERPVEWVTWEDAARFCNALSEREGLRPCYSKDPRGAWVWERDADGYRLPTESEWEFACRAGTTGAYGLAGPDAELADYAWFHGNANGETHDVANKKRNPWGIFDMHGNVWEWCWDWHAQYAANDHSDGPKSGNDRVLRGGSFVNEPVHLRSAYRGRAMPTTRVRIHGFRCVRGARE